MGVISRVRDIVNSNINAMMEVAEDPEKLLRMIIREMEDTIVEVKVACAGAMATRRKVETDLAHAKEVVDRWNHRAELAIDRGREDMAREALLEKRRASERVESQEQELSLLKGLIEQYTSDITDLENKLASARERQQTLYRHEVRERKDVEKRRNQQYADFGDAIARFEEIEQRVERMEAEANVVNLGRNKCLDERFREIELSDEIERELAALKARVHRPEAIGAGIGS